jgi:hypothetical protein
MNPAESYAECAPRLRDLAADRWNGAKLDCAINGGFVLATPAVLEQMARRIIELVAELEKRGIVQPHWNTEQLAVSLAAGECGLTPLEDDWNVTPQSPVADGAVRLWHYNDAVEATRTIKRNLDDPEIVFDALAELEPQWPAVTRRFRELYKEVMARVPSSQQQPRTERRRRVAQL